MLYEKTKCPTCGSSQTNLEAVVLEAAKSLPDGFEIYDFGGGVTIAPTPPGDPILTHFLTSHIVGVCRAGSRIVTGVTFDFKDLSSEKMAALLAKAVAHNASQQREFEIAA